MADKFIKVNLPKADCRNIYFVNNDDLFGSKETVRNHWNKILEQVDLKIRMHDLRNL